MVARLGPGAVEPARGGGDDDVVVVAEALEHDAV